MSSSARGAVVASFAAAVASLVAVLPAEAGPPITLPGSLSVTSPASATLGTVSSLAGAAITVSGGLGNVTVTDSRAVSVGWSVTATSSNFAHGSDTIPKSAATVNGPAAVTSSTGLVAGAGAFVGSQASMATGGVIATAVAVGANTASFGPSMTVVLPVGTVPGAYTGTITFTAT